MPTVPRREMEAREWVERFNAKVQEHGDAAGIPFELRDELTDSHKEWKSYAEQYRAARFQAQTLRALRDSYREKSETLTERIALLVRGSAVEPWRFNLEGRDPHNTPIRAPKVAPRLEATTLKDRKVEIKFRGAGLKRKKPDGAKNCEVWLKIGGDPPESVAECRHAGIYSRSPQVFEFAPEEVGEAAHFIVRWLSPRGEPGPASLPESATIPLSIPKPEPT